MNADIVRLRADANALLTIGVHIAVTSNIVAAADEIDRLRAENEAFRQAIRDGDGPNCEDVCQTECIGVCGVTFDDDDGEFIPVAPSSTLQQIAALDIDGDDR